jgi:hypothetical protein
MNEIQAHPSHTTTPKGLQSKLSEGAEDKQSNRLSPADDPKSSRSLRDISLRLNLFWGALCLGLSDQLRQAFKNT